MLRPARHRTRLVARPEAVESVMSYSPWWSIRSVVARHRVLIEEYDISPGRPLLVQHISCPTCWGQSKILEAGPLGYMPVICADCEGRGWR
jgi:hypothetical protein